MCEKYEKIDVLGLQFDTETNYIIKNVLASAGCGYIIPFPRQING